MKIEFKPDGDAEDGLYSTNASAVVYLEGDKPDDINEMKLAGYVFIPNIVNGKSIIGTSKDSSISWVALAIQDYIEQCGRPSDDIYRLEGTME